MNTSFIILLVLIILGIVLYHKFFKSIKLGTVNFVTGAPKTGKSTLSVALCLKTYNKLLRSYNVKLFFLKCFQKVGLLRKVDISYQKPLLYSNIPIKCKGGYVPLTKDILERKVKLSLYSVVYIGEFSLVADSFSYMNKELNEKTELFFKLLGHESHCTCICDSQSVKDVHYNLKRVLSSYVYIHHIQVIPFFIICYVREFAYIDTDNNSVVNTMQQDVESTLKRVIFPKSVWKKFDYRCYSVLTDNLPLANSVVTDIKSFKQNDIVSYKDYKFLKSDVKESVENAKKE